MFLFTKGDHKFGGKKSPKPWVKASKFDILRPYFFSCWDFSQPNLWPSVHLEFVVFRNSLINFKSIWDFGTTFLVDCGFNQWRQFIKQWSKIAIISFRFLLKQCWLGCGCCRGCGGQRGPGRGVDGIGKKTSATKNQSANFKRILLISDILGSLT